MTPFIINGKAINIPTGWHEVNVRQFLAIRKMQKQDFCELLAIFSGLDYKFWFDAEIEESQMNMILQAFTWTQEKIDLNTFPVPVTITIGGKALEVPNDLRIKTLGQKQFFEQMVMPVYNDTGELTEAIATALAIYLQPLYTEKKFDPDTIQSMIDLCLQCMITEALPLATFFLRNYFGLEKKNGNFNTIQRKRRKKQA